MISLVGAYSSWYESGKELEVQQLRSFSDQYIVEEKH